MKFATVGALVLVATFGLAQDLSVHVTYSTTGKSVRKILPELSKLVNLSLTSMPQTERDILVISVKDVPLSALMDRIAKVTSGEWSHTPAGEYKLLADRGARNREYSTETALKVAALQKTIDTRVKGLTKPAAKDEKSSVSIGIGNNGATSSTSFAPNTPEEQAITKLLATMSKSDLANIADGERLVFATQPTHAQIPLAAKATAIVNELIQKHNAEKPEKGKEEIAALNDPNVPDFVRKMMEKRNKPIENVQKAILVANHLPFFPTVQLELRLYDSNGKVVFSQPSILSMDALMEMASIFTTQQQKPPEIKGQTPVEFSPNSKALMGALKGMVSMTGVKTTLNLPLDLQKQLFQPDQVDPLSYMTSDTVMSLAKKRNLPLVANLPDGMLSLTTMMVGNSTPTVEAFEKDLTERKEIEQVVDEGWLTLKPSKPNEARLRRLDRVALTVLLEATLAKDVPSLDDIATFALKSEPVLQSPIGSLYATLFVPGLVQQGMDGLVDWNLLRLYGSLNPFQRQNLLNGGRIPFANMNQAQQQYMRNVIFGSSVSLQVSDGSKPKSEGLQIPMLDSIFGGDGDYRKEPTEVLPEGNLGAGFLEMKASQEPFLSPVSSNDQPVMAGYRALGTTELAIFKFFKEDPAYKQISGFMPSFDRYRLGKRTSYRMTLQLTREVSVSQTLNDNNLPKDAPTYDANNLPDDVNQRVNKAMADVKKSPLGALGGLMGGQKSPPPK